MNKVIKKDDWKVSVWAGGTTNEIFIYPEDSSYSDRIFKARKVYFKIIWRYETSTHRSLWCGNGRLSNR